MSVVDITLFVTSCGRPELLKKTLISFVKFNSYKIKEAVIIEDSEKQGIIDFVHDILPFPCKVIYNEVNLGMMKSTLKGIEYVNTDYVFHCEDDWEFFCGGFIEQSLNILSNDDKAILVGLIPYNRYIGTCYEENIVNGTHRYMKEYGTIGNYTTNPSLRRKNIYDMYNGFKNEGEMSMAFREKGKKIAMTLKTKGFVRHIGNHNSAYKSHSSNE